MTQPEVHHVCSECDYVLSETDEFCPTHPKAMILSLLAHPIGPANHENQIQTARNTLIDHADSDDAYNAAFDVIRAHYYRSVRQLADSIAKEAFIRWRSGVDYDEALYDLTHETVDGCSWVIYTAQARMVTAISDNHDAFADNYGDGEYGSAEQVAFEAIATDIREVFPSDCYVLSNGSAGCIPDNVERYDSPDDAIEAFKQSWDMCELGSELDFAGEWDAAEPPAGVVFVGSDYWLDLDYVADKLRSEGICYLPKGAGADYVELYFSPEPDGE